QRSQRRSKRLLLGYRHRELTAPFAPPAAENLAPSPRPHSLAKSVRAFAALAVGLKCPLHGFLRTSLDASGPQDAPEKRTSIASAPHSVNERPVNVTTAARTRIGIFRRGIAGAIRTLPTHRRQISILRATCA